MNLDLFQFYPSNLPPQIIESRLKVVLPEDLGSSLMDGVVLCHLANHIRPRSVASIHVPSPAVVRVTNAGAFKSASRRAERRLTRIVVACRSSPSSAWRSAGGTWRTSWTPAGK